MSNRLRDVCQCPPLNDGIIQMKMAGTKTNEKKNKKKYCSHFLSGLANAKKEATYLFATRTCRSKSGAKVRTRRRVFRFKGETPSLGSLFFVIHMFAMTPQKNTRVQDGLCSTFPRCSFFRAEGDFTPPKIKWSILVFRKICFGRGVFRGCLGAPLQGRSIGAPC